jgi:hypothetical protein
MDIVSKEDRRDKLRNCDISHLQILSIMSCFLSFCGYTRAKALSFSKDRFINSSARSSTEDFLQYDELITYKHIK